MKQCECGSCAINIDPEKELWDVCYYKYKYESLKSIVYSLMATIRGIGEGTEEFGKLKKELDKKINNMKKEAERRIE